VLGAVEAMGRATRFAMMVADERAQRYRLYVETDLGVRRDRSALAEAVDTRLAALNIEYRCKRESERLGPIDAHWLAAGTGDAYKQHCVSSGQREGQFKASALAYARDFRFDLDAHVEE
jgi:hypothetical protein